MSLKGMVVPNTAATRIDRHVCSSRIRTVIIMAAARAVAITTASPGHGVMVTRTDTAARPGIGRASESGPVKVSRLPQA